MKKTFCFILIVMFFSNNCKIYADIIVTKYVNSSIQINQKTISIKDLILLKNYSNEQIHDYLILNDWVFMSNEKKRKGGSFVPFEEQVILYKHNFYDINISIIKIVSFKDQKREVISKTDKYIEVTTESSNEYKIILNDLYNNNYKIYGKEKFYPSLELATTNVDELMEKMKIDYVSIKKTSLDYLNGSNKVSLFTEVFEKYDRNMKSLKRIKYSLKVDMNKTINNVESSTKTDKELNSCLINNQELLKQNEKLKNDIQELNAIFKNSTILTSKGAENIEKALVSIKEKDLKILRLQEALTRKDSATLELIKALKKQK